MAFVAVARPGHCCPLWLLGLVALLPPRACGQCGALPKLNHAIPFRTQPTERFPINTQVQYKCVDNYVKIPGKPDSTICLSNSQWSNLQEFCGRSCLVPTRFRSAVLSDEDLRKSYYPVGTTVRYDCRPGYQSTDQNHFLTCLDDLTWSKAPEFCTTKSCGVPKSPEHGRLVETTNNQYGAKVNIRCDDGHKISGRSFIQCFLSRTQDQVEWTKLPTCELITCSTPPNIANGMSNGSGMGSFGYNSLVTYRCDHNFSLTGNASIHCTTKDKTNGVWNGSAPECKAIITQNKPTSIPPGGTGVGDTFSDSLGLGLFIDLGIGASIGIVIVVVAGIALTVWKKNGTSQLIHASSLLLPPRA